MEKPRILIVEDESVIVMNLENNLAELGYEVCGYVSTGKKAVRKAAELEPDLILMDIVLKGTMDGIEAAKIIKDTLDIPIVYMTGNADVPTITRARETDPHGYLLKPINMLHLFSTIDTVLRRHTLEIRLRENEEKLRRIIENSKDGIILVDERGRIIEWNPGMELNTGVMKSEVIGRPVWGVQYQLMEKEKPTGLSEADLKSIYQKLLESCREELPERYQEGEIMLRDGTSRWVEDLVFQIPTSKGTMICIFQRDITERRRSEEALRESEERYRALFDQSPVGVFIFDKNLIITECNERFAEMVETPQREIIGFDSARQREKAVIPKMNETINGNPSFWEGWFHLPDRDETVYHSVNYSPLRDADGTVIGGIAVVNDLTKRKRTEEQLKISEERSRLLVENANESIAVLQDWRFMFANPRFRELTGYTGEELGSRRFTEFVHPDDREMLDDRYRKRMGGDTSHLSYEARFIDRQGNTKWTELNTVLFQWEGKPASLLFIRDITDRKKAEEERRKMEAQIQQTQKLESLGVLAGGIAHDFNNLLMAILGNIDLALLDLTPSSSARGNLLEAAKASQRAADLCRQMLAYSGRGRFTSESLSLNALVEDMEHMLEVSVSKKAVIRYNLAPGLPAIDADATQVRQIIMNLVINASDAIGVKSGVISISTGAMECDRSYLSETWLNELHPEGLYVFIEVADTGSGMDPGTLPRIFDPFFTTKFTGRGLGLAAVLGIVRGHHGAIKVYSEKGKGTTFKILFPAAGRPAGRPDGISGSVQEWRGSGTVLLADDEETIRALGRQMLERLGFTVLTAADGRETLDIFREHAGELTCVILDLTMPHMDGEETFRELRRIRKDVRVIMSSGYNEQEINQRFAGKGIAGFIQKPYQMADLAAKLKEILP
ncbi:MAG: hypothetical protein A2176_16110 [Spirochaetes bacterium RBG_13_51_14]|nr:MAG: hypothetical protein A2176_16110 [Spirochaetes bacterium RBG_13_51_14]